MKNHSEKRKINIRNGVKEFIKNSKFRCKFCKLICKTQETLDKHESHCRWNPNSERYLKSVEAMRKMNDRFDKQKVKLSKDVELDITKGELKKYKAEHTTCEICGKTVDEATKNLKNLGIHNLCVDHDHKTMKFRGLLCSLCNRQLGWYEKNKVQIEKYLNKTNLLGS